MTAQAVETTRGYRELGRVLIKHGLRHVRSHQKNGNSLTRLYCWPGGHKKVVLNNSNSETIWSPACVTIVLKKSVQIPLNRKKSSVIATLPSPMMCFSARIG
jgi:hypothetical protein